MKVFDEARFKMATHLGRVLLYIRTKETPDDRLINVWNNLSDDERFCIIQLKRHLEIPLKDWERL